MAKEKELSDRAKNVQQAMADGYVADPATLEHPTAAELAAALDMLSKGYGDQDEAKSLLMSVRDYQLVQGDSGAYALMRSPGYRPPNGVTEFAPPAVVVTTKGQE